MIQHLSLYATHKKKFVDSSKSENCAKRQDCLKIFGVWVHRQHKPQAHRKPLSIQSYYLSLKNFSEFFSFFLFFCHYISSSCKFGVISKTAINNLSFNFIVPSLVWYSVGSIRAHIQLSTLWFRFTFNAMQTIVSHLPPAWKIPYRHSQVIIIFQWIH